MTEKPTPTPASSPRDLFSTHPDLGDWLSKNPLGEVFKAAVARGDVAFMDGAPPQAVPDTTAPRSRRSTP